MEEVFTMLVLCTITGGEGAWGYICQGEAEIILLGLYRAQNCKKLRYANRMLKHQFNS